jgi:threonine dehydratase
MLSLYQVEGNIAEPAGALASAATRQLPGSMRSGPVVCVVSGGNNDVSRYSDIVERSLVHEGLKHYFLVTFPQQPGALRRFLDSVLGPEDDITLFEYVKKSNRETGPALVGIELATWPDCSPGWRPARSGSNGCRRARPSSLSWFDLPADLVGVGVVKALEDGQRLLPAQVCRVGVAGGAAGVAEVIQYLGAVVSRADLAE